MMANKRQMTAAQEILIAAADLFDAGHREFSEWDLSVAAWKRDHNRFGCRGYEDLYPDHKRVMMEFMGQTKKDNPVRQGWLRRARTNYYEITSLGAAEADRLREVVVGGEPSMRSGQVVYDAVSRYVFHPVFRKHLDDASEPRTWLGAQAFLGLSRLDAVALDDSLRVVQQRRHFGASVDGGVGSRRTAHREHRRQAVGPEARSHSSGPILRSAQAAVRASTERHQAAGSRTEKRP